MNRPIKFRAWRPSFNRFRFFDLSTGFNVENSDVFPSVEQFTGMLDKEGKEIYEGDILESVSFHPSAVEYSEELAAFSLADSTQVEVLSVYPNNKWAIIGNIHENPSILKCTDNLTL